MWHICKNYRGWLKNIYWLPVYLFPWNNQKCFTSFSKESVARHQESLPTVRVLMRVSAARYCSHYQSMIWRNIVLFPPPLLQGIFGDACSDAGVCTTYCWLVWALYQGNTVFQKELTEVASFLYKWPAHFECSFRNTEQISILGDMCNKLRLLFLVNTYFDVSKWNFCLIQKCKCY